MPSSVERRARSTWDAPANEGNIPESCYLVSPWLAVV